MSALRFATPDDAGTILSFIRALAEYEKEPCAVRTDLDTLHAQLSASPAPFECLIAEEGGEPVGFALFFHNYSTWRGKQGIWLEDLFVLPAARGRGIGKALLTRVAAVAAERDCARMEWAVLDWNTPALEFYRSLGALGLDAWTIHRLTDDALAAVAALSEPAKR